MKTAALAAFALAAPRPDAAVGSPRAPFAGRPQEASVIETLSRTLAEIPHEQSASVTVELVLMRRAGLSPVASSEFAAGAVVHPPGVRAERREYRFPPAEDAGRKAAVERLRGELEGLLAGAPPESVNLRVSLRVSNAASASGGLADYLARVRARIEAQKAYPSIARQLRVEGRVLLRALIRADGSLGESDVVAPAAPSLDRAALAAVRGAAPFPSPRELGLDSVTVEVPMAYVLR